MNEPSGRISARAPAAVATAQQPADHAAWLAARRRGLGASDAAAAVGLSRWKTNQQLAREKLGLEAPADLDGNPAVERGREAEPLIRALFALDHPEYEVEYRGEFDVVRRPGAPWYLATLDGRLTEKATGARGILEIKTGAIASALAASAWFGRVPEHYFCQVLHQFNAWPEATFAVLAAYLENRDERTGQTHSMRFYPFRRDDVDGDAAWLLGKEREFWAYIERGEVPPLLLPQI